MKRPYTETRRRVLSLTVVACAVVAAAWCAGSATALASPREEKRTLRPEIHVEKLDNGLTIYVIEDHSAPLATYEIWFRVGSSHEWEPAPGEDHGTTGLSHFFEHLMFRGTKAHPNFFEEIYALGGVLNAWTWVDSTCYWEKIPSRHLAKIVEMESDRLANMDLSFPALETEREVVKSERLLRTENDPTGSMMELLFATAYRQHPYQWPTVGWMRDLNAITLQEASDYHHAHYAPNNAFVVVVGDVDPHEVVEVVQANYGALRAQTIPKRPRPEEPPQDAERRDYLFKEVDTQQFVAAWHVPAIRSRERMVLDLVDEILNGGRSSRLKRRLIYGDEPIVSGLSSSTYPWRDPALYVWTVRMLPGHDDAEALDAIQEEMDRIAREGVTREELKVAVNRLRADVVRSMLTNQGRADLVGFAILTADDPFLYFDRLAEYEQVTPEEVKAVVAKYLRREQRTVVAAVSPRRLVDLVDAYAKAQGQGADPKAATLAHDALEWMLGWMELEGKRRDVARETDALERLAARAEAARKTADEATRKAIDEFMTKSDKGYEARKHNLDKLRAAYAKAREDLAARRTALAERAAALEEALGHGPLAAIVRLVTSKRAPAAHTADPAGAGDATDSVGWAVADLVRAAWADLHGEHDAAAALRSDAAGRIESLRALPEEYEPVVRQARAFLYDTRRVAVRPWKDVLRLRWLDEVGVD